MLRSFSPGKPVCGIPDPKWGELVMACVVLKPGIVLAADELVAYCWQSLAHTTALWFFTCHIRWSPARSPNWKEQDDDPRRNHSADASTSAAFWKEKQ